MKKTIVSVLIALATVLSVVIIDQTMNPLSARDCSNNAVAKCGVWSVSEMRNAYNKDTTKGLRNIYNGMGISTDTVNNATVKEGYVHKDGRVTIGNEVVATGAISAGRQITNNQRTKHTYNGTTYYTSPTSNFRATKLSAFVFLDKNGRFLGAVLKECGNPIKGTPTKPAPKPSVVCDALKATTINRNTYRFTASATAKDGAKITGYTFNFGDGTSKKQAGNAIQHSYAKPGTYTATVTVHSNIADVTSAKCKVTVKVVPAPSATCDSLTATSINRNTFRFTAKATAKDGAKINGYTFNFGDGTTKKQAGATIQHSYAKPGTYTATVTVDSTAGNNIAGEKCKVTVKVAPEPAAACTDLTATITKRTDVKLTARANAVNGATISAYVFTVVDASGKEVASQTVTSTANSASTNIKVSTPGNYTAKVVVKTSVGDKTATACEAAFTIDREKIPGVSITKKVDGVDHKEVAVNQEFVYQLVVTNKGETNLKNVAVTDNAPAHVQFLRADKGIITDNKWSHTIPSLKVGESASFAITAKVIKEVEGRIKNTACVDAPAVPSTPDDCDDATVEVPPTPEVPVIEVCELESKKMITIKQDEFDSSKHSTNVKDCEETPVTPEVPTELPTTGLGNPILNAIALSTLVGSVIAYSLSRRSIV